MLYHSFPDLQWLKGQTESRFSGRRWPNVLLNVKSGPTLRDNIRGPLSLFSNVSGESFVTVDGRRSVVSADYFFISNNTQRYTLEIKSAETFNIHFGENWLDNIVDDAKPEFYNKLYPKDDVVRYLQAQLGSHHKSSFEREEILTQLVVHLLLTNRGEKIRLDSLDATRVSTRREILRRLHLVTDYIYSFYQNDISLDELSKVGMLSKFHFLRAFKQAFGMAPHKFLNQVRMEKARELLKGDMEVGMIGKAVGIDEASSFSRLFRKEFGASPVKFRN